MFFWAWQRLALGDARAPWARGEVQVGIAGSIAGGVATGEELSTEVLNLKHDLKTAKSTYKTQRPY